MIHTYLTLGIHVPSPASWSVCSRVFSLTTRLWPALYPKFLNQCWSLELLKTKLCRQHGLILILVEGVQHCRWSWGEKAWSSKSFTHIHWKLVEQYWEYRWLLSQNWITRQIGMPKRKENWAYTYIYKVHHMHNPIIQIVRTFSIYNLYLCHIQCLKLCYSVVSLYNWQLQDYTLKWFLSS